MAPHWWAVLVIECLIISHQGGLAGDDAVALLAPVPAQQWFFNDMCLMRWYLLASNLPLANHR
jgi:hypothetical protein